MTKAFKPGDPVIWETGKHIFRGDVIEAPEDSCDVSVRWNDGRSGMVHRANLQHDTAKHKLATFEELCTRIAGIREKLTADMTAVFVDFTRGVCGVAKDAEHLPDVHQRALAFTISTFEHDLEGIIKSAIDKAANEELGE